MGRPILKNNSVVMALLRRAESTSGDGQRLFEPSHG